MISRISHLALCLCTLLLFTGCNLEDDLNELFVGKTWYMTGASINGKVMNSEVKKFYANGKNAYYINFSSGNFTATLASGTSFSGTWVADGRKQTIKLFVNNKPNNLTTFDLALYNIIENLSKYNGDINVMELKEDDSNLIRFSSNR